MTPSQIGMLLMLIGGVTATIGAFMYNWKSSERNAERHTEVRQGQAHTDSLVTSGTGAVRSDVQSVGTDVQEMKSMLKDFYVQQPDLEEQLSAKYPSGFALYGYMNGKLNYVEIPSTGIAKSTVDWSKSNFDFTSVPGRLRVNLFDLTYESPRFGLKMDRLFVSNININWRGHKSISIAATEYGHWVAHIEAMEYKRYTVYVIGFSMEAADYRVPRNPNPVDSERTPVTLGNLIITTKAV